jgi:hypothetical protein
MDEMLATTTEPAVAPERPPYPVGVPVKFSPDGVVQRFPGNTTLCHVPSDSPLIPGLHIVYDALDSHPTLSRLIRLVPRESWHMTVFDGVCDPECDPGVWPAGLERKPLDECTREFSKRLRKFGLGLKKEDLAPPYRMRVRCFDNATIGVGLEVEGATQEEDKRMRRLRDRLADTFGFRAPNHETYGLHITIAYLLRHVDGEDRFELNEVFAKLLPEVKMEFELRAVEFCIFEDMCAYPRQFYLGDKEEET